MNDLDIKKAMGDYIGSPSKTVLRTYKKNNLPKFKVSSREEPVAEINYSEFDTTNSNTNDILNMVKVVYEIPEYCKVIDDVDNKIITLYTRVTTITKE